MGLKDKEKAFIKAIENAKKNLNLKLRLKKRTEEFTNLLYHTLFDAETNVADNIKKLENDFDELVNLACWDTEKPCSSTWETYLEKLPGILAKLNLDAEAFLANDPAANSIEEVYLAYPGFFAIAIYRLSHELCNIGLPLVPRLMTEYAHRLSGTEINPGAQIGDSFFIDHATGTIIGETTVIKNNVKIYQGVTLGALSVKREFRNTKRHPTVEDNVIIYANATILGGDTVIGANSIVGGNVWITSSVPPNSIISSTRETKIKSAN